jgi:hypothetical protein
MNGRLSHQLFLSSLEKIDILPPYFKHCNSMADFLVSKLSHGISDNITIQLQIARAFYCEYSCIINNAKMLGK